MFIFAIFSRWIHVVCACVAIGGFVFFRFAAPAGLRLVGEEQREPAMLAMRRVFKMLIHTVILFLLLSGIYNSYLAWDKYDLDKAVLHALWGVHVLLALLAITLSLYVLAGRQPPRAHLKWMAINVVILLLAVGAASSLKLARERAVAAHAAANSLEMR
jgi:uncharacterized membrane protein